MLIRWSAGVAHVATRSNRDWVLNKKPGLLLHCDGANGSTTFKDSSPSAHTVTANGTAQISTAQSKWGASGLFDGDSDYLSIPDSANWDISTNFTIDLWARHDSVSGNECYIGQLEDDDNEWWFYYSHGYGVKFRVESGSALIVEVTGNVAVTNSIWTHLAMCKVGNDYGIYQQGVQTAYKSDASIDTFTGSLYIGAKGGSTHYFDGHLDEIRIVSANPFGAAPVVGLTDTIKVPTRPYISWR